MNTVKTLIAMILVTLIFAGATSAKMYKWVDEKGVVHFSDRPPADTGTAVQYKT